MTGYHGDTEVMDQPSWSQSNFYNYYPTDPRPSDRTTVSPPQHHHDQLPPSSSQSNLGHPDDSTNPRRYSLQHSNFLPPPPPPPPGHSNHAGHPTSGAGGGGGGSGGGAGAGGGGGHSHSHSGSSSSQSGSMALPPFSQTFNSYSPTNHVQYSMYGPGTSNGPSNPHNPNGPSSNSGNSPVIPIAPPAHTYNYPIQSPLSMAPPLPGQGVQPRQPPPHHYSESPRLNTSLPPTGGGGGYGSSPSIRHLSPTSPVNALGPPGLPQMNNHTSGGSSSSSYPSAQIGTTSLPGLSTSQSGPSSGTRGRPTRGAGGKGKRRATQSLSNSIIESDNQHSSVGGGGGGGGGGNARESQGSWSGGNDDDDYGDGDEHGGQPWGMPQDEYKALNPRDKKQVRNRIGARRFRAKRKDYVANLEVSTKEKDDEIMSLRSQVESQRNEINDYRRRLGLPPLPPPSLSPQHQSHNQMGGGGGVGEQGLGLSISNDEWGSGVDEKMRKD